MSVIRLSPAGAMCMAVVFWTLASVSAYNTPQPVPAEGWYKSAPSARLLSLRLSAGAPARQPAHSIKGSITPGLGPIRDFLEGRRLFERETFGGNGRTCATCHGQETGTVSPQDARKLMPLLQVPIDGRDHTVAWAWERPGGGRAFGFSGLHFHRNWELPAYRRMVAQGVLWSLDLPVPAEGVNVDVSEDVLKVQRPKPEGSRE